MLLIGLLPSLCGLSQNLPIDFEGSVTTANFIDFDGGAASVIPNPFQTGNNTSNTVGRMVRSGGTVWAGSKIALAANVDFSVLTKISMKIYTTAPAGTVVKFKLEGTGSSVDVDALTTTSGAWETLEWIFAGTPNDLNEIVLMFDFGNIGNGSANSTFYFDNLQQIPGPPAPVAANLPIDFESNVVSSDFLSFAGAGTNVITNPQMNGINTSSKVCEIVRYGGDIWAGSRISLVNNLDFSTMWHLTMKVYTDAPVGTRLKLKLEGGINETSLDVLTTVSGAWETLDWNFDGQPNVFNKITFMFDYGQVGDGTASSTFLFDDLQQMVGPAIPLPNPVSLPIDFETNVVSTDFTNFYGAMTSVITNPQAIATNTSSKVGHFLRSGGQSWAQSKIQLTDFMDYSAQSWISMKVYTEAPVGTLLKLKVESTISGAANEKDAYTTVSGDWQTYYFNFAGDPPVYNVITLMLGYGSVGDAGPNSTFLFDDIQQSFDPAIASVNKISDPSELRGFPNPVKDIFTIQAEEPITNITIVNLLGEEVMVIDSNNSSVSFSVADYSKGVHFAKISTVENVRIIQFIVE